MMKLSVLVVAAALALAPASAIAKCGQKDLKGWWSAYSAGGIGSKSYWVTCFININKKGKMKKTQCIDSDGDIGTLDKGTAKILVPNDCSYTAQFFIDGIENRVFHGTISRDGLTSNGVGIFPNGTFIFSMTKL